MATARTPDVITIADPRPGTVLELVAGSRLCLRFRTSLGPSRWHLVGHPGHLLPLVREGTELHFLVFDGAPSTLRLERRHPARGIVHEVCELRIEVSERDERSHPVASRRSA